MLLLQASNSSRIITSICALGIEYKTGKSLRVSKPGLQKLKKGFQYYQKLKYPELSNSPVDHNKNNLAPTEKEYQFKLRTGRESDKQNLLSMLTNCSKKASSH